MDLHPNINPKLLTLEGRLLTRAELRFVDTIESYTNQLQHGVTQLNQYKQDLIAVFDQRTIANDPYQHIDKIFIPQSKEADDAYQHRILHELDQFFNLSRSEGTKNFIHELKASLLAIPGPESSYETYLDCLNETWEKHEDDAQDITLQTDLENQENTFTDLISHAENHLIEHINQFKTQHDTDFDLDENYQLRKIPKQLNHLNYSVIYTKQPGDDKSTAFALYRGSEGRMLGEGGFGKVKLCQDIHTGDWMAVKIQQRIMKEASIGENAALKYLNRFAGELTRDQKYYSIQTLLPGENLYKHMQKNSDNPVFERLLIAEKAAILVDKFHKSYLHCDLKLENFIWDSKTKELFLCDFGMSMPLGSNQISVKNLSGSGSHLAPEIDDRFHRGVVEYSKKSDIYALGKVFGALFKDLSPEPQGVKDLIERMTMPNPDDRLGSTQKIIESLQLISKNFPAQAKSLQ